VRSFRRYAFAATVAAPYRIIEQALPGKLTKLDRRFARVGRSSFNTSPKVAREIAAAFLSATGYDNDRRSVEAAGKYPGRARAP
jgi:hypothetical protein